MTSDNPMVAALLRERAGYVTRGMNDRVAQVDEQLALHGYTEAAETSGDDVSRKTPPKARRQQRPEQA